MSFRSKYTFVLRNALVPIIGWKKWNEVQFRAIHGYEPNFEVPQTFLEYLQYLKYYGRGGELAPFVDKFLVKSYVAKTIGPQHVIPTCDVVYCADAFRFEGLPDRWIAKSAHAAGWNYIKNNSAKGENALRSIFRRWLDRNYYDVSGEVNYRYITPKILIEPLISTPGEDLKDYKIWCFNGKAMFIGIHGDRSNVAKGQIFHLDGSPSTWRYPEIPVWREPPEFPENLSELVRVAQELAQPFPFVRVDLYSTSKQIFFGELTFTPGDGINIRIPFDEDKQFGEIIMGARPANLDVHYEILLP